ncbi:hypothetical protein VTK26DRAFT_3744 [Humicola hyalothermophila]
MLAIRLFWLQAVLVTAQLVDLEGVLGREGAASSTAVEEAGAKETAPPPTSSNIIVSDGFSAAAEGILDPALDPVLESTGLSGEDDAVASETSSAEDRQPPATSAPEPTPDPEPTSVESVVETAAPESTPEPTPELTPEPKTEPAPVTEQAPPPPPTPLPTSVQPQPEEQQQPKEKQQEQPANVPVSTPESSTAPAPPPATNSPAPVAPEPSVSSASPAVVPASSATSGTAPPSPAASSVQSEQAAPTTGPGNADPATTTLEPAASSSDEPTAIPVLITASGSTFMSVFIPPSPAAVLNGNIIDTSGGDDSGMGDIANADTNPFSDGGRVNNNNNNNNNDPSSPSSPSDPNSPNPEINNTVSKGNDADNGDVEEEALPLSTKIGVGVGVGAGTVVLVVALTWLLWRRRMRKGRADGRSSSSRGDLEATARTPEEKAKMDWESEHDVAFDFGAFLRRATSRGGESVRSGGGIGGAVSDGGDGNVRLKEMAGGGGVMGGAVGNPQLPAAVPLELDGMAVDGPRR